MSPVLYPDVVTFYAPCACGKDVYWYGVQPSAGYVGRHLLEPLCSCLPVSYNSNASPPPPSEED